MNDAGVAAYTGRWRPSSVSPRAAAFARDVIAAVQPDGQERAKNLLWAAGQLADYAASLGLDLQPGVVFHPSVIERFARRAPGLPGVARRTLRTNQRFIGRRVVPGLYPADVPLPRERAKAPCTAAEIGGFLALADAQPAAERRMRAVGLVCLGAGRRADPRRLARSPGQRHDRPVRRARGGRPRSAGADGPRPSPLSRPAAGRGPVRLELSDHLAHRVLTAGFSDRAGFGVWTMSARVL
jgi:hypothetical protein